MSYRDKLSPWCIVCQSPTLKHSIVARCRRRSFAEEHMRVLQKINPMLCYEIVFDPIDYPID